MNTKMMLPSSLTILLSVAVLHSSPAYANGIYAHAELARSNVREDLDVGTSVVPFEEFATGFRLAVGYDVVDYFSFEGGYVDFGKVDFNSGPISVEAEADGLETTLVGRIPVGDRFSLVGRAGYLWWDAKVGAAGLVSTESDHDFFFGFGGEFHATDRFAVTAGWSLYKLDSTDIGYASVGLRGQFGKVD